jgi:quinol monooxygenase YgiN
MTSAQDGVITLIVTMSIKPDREAEFLATAGEFVDWVQANEPDTLLYVLTRHPSREHTYVWVERYRNESAIEAHRNGERFAGAIAVVRASLDGTPEALRLEQILPR